MENASKALIIAGSVLLAILLIALGVTIFNNARNAASTGPLDSAEINMFNQQFDKFIGSEEILGSQVKNLLSTAISNASTNKDELIKLPTIAWESRTEQAQCANTDSATIQAYIDQISAFRSSVVSRNYYTVSCTYAGTGLINSITIHDA